ncbi:hypothetical protein VBG39_09270, partial [Streptococcus parauberis]
MPIPSVLSQSNSVFPYLAKGLCGLFTEPSQSFHQKKSLRSFGFNLRLRKALMPYLAKGLCCLFTEPSQSFHQK